MTIQPQGPAGTPMPPKVFHCKHGWSRLSSVEASLSLLTSEEPPLILELPVHARGPGDVEKMMLHNTLVDAAFSAVFFLTFQLFARPAALVTAVIAR